MWLFQKDKIHGGYQTAEGGDVIPVKALPFEDEYGEQGENRDGDYFLYDFQLHQGEWTAVLYEADSVSVHLAYVFG